MPHIPDSQHDQHDLQLIAEFAAGPRVADAATSAGALALVEACAECADLARDIRAIAAALPAMPAPARPRDFRLTEDQAASLRPRGLRGLLATLASPKLSFAAPLGAGMAALGIVGILVTTGGAPFGGAARDGAGQAPQVQNAPEEKVGALEAASPAPGELVDPNLTLEAPSGDLFATGEADAGLSAGVAGEDPATTPSPVLGIAIVLVFVGAALLAARLIAQGLARAP